MRRSDILGSMAATKINFESVRKMAAGMPGVEEGRVYGSPALKLNGGLLVCLATNKSAEPNSLIACVGFEAREELVKQDPERYYWTPHYENSPVVLARLCRMNADALHRLLEVAQRFAAGNLVNGSGRVRKRMPDRSRRKRP